MTSQKLALVDVLAQIHDPRQSSGKRYSLQAILSLAIAAMLCGYKSYLAIAEWGRHYGQHLAQALGFTNGKTPCAATFHNIFADSTNSNSNNNSPLGRSPYSIKRPPTWRPSP